MIGQIAALVPVRHASVAFAVGGALVASAVGVFVYNASEGIVSSRWLRVLLGLSVVLLPVAQLEIADNGVNTIWYLLVALFWAALWRPRTRAGASVAAVMAFAAAASTSLGLVFAPLFAARAIAVPRRLREHVATVGWALGCVVQLLVIATSHTSRLTPHNPVNAVPYYTREVLLPTIGWHLSWHLRDLIGVNGATALVGGLHRSLFSPPWWSRSPGDAGCSWLPPWRPASCSRRSPRPSPGAGPGQPVTIRVEHGARYSTLPILLLEAALIVAADACARRWWPRPKAIVAVAALVAVLAVGWATDFRYPVRRLAGPASAGRPRPTSGFATASADPRGQSRSPSTTGGERHGWPPRSAAPACATEAPAALTAQPERDLHGLEGPLGDQGGVLISTSLSPLIAGADTCADGYWPVTQIRRYVSISERTAGSGLS